MDKETLVFTNSLEENLLQLREVFVYSEDFIIDYTPINGEDAFLVYIESIVDKKTIEQRVIKPLHIMNSSDEKVKGQKPSSLNLIV